MKTKVSQGCCQLQEIFGFGHTEYDGSGSRSLTPEEFEKELTEREKQLKYWSTWYLTINSDQYKIYADSLKKLNWRLINVAESLGHPTVVFMYVKSSPLANAEKTKIRLTELGIKVRIPGTLKKLKLKK
jgi:hypothetical protein